MSATNNIAAIGVTLLLIPILVGFQQKPNKITVKVVDVIPEEMSWETNQDSEPFLSVDPADTSRLVVSAFTENPAGGNSTSAPVFVSTDAGNTWIVRNSIPIPLVTVDITHSYDGKGTLQAGALKSTPTSQGSRPDLLKLTSTDPALAQPMGIQGKRENVDQPFVVTIANRNQDLVYIGENYLGSQTDATAAVEVWDGSSAPLTPSIIEHRKVDMQNGPSVRVAIARDGKAYAAFFGWRQYERVDKNEGWITSDIVLVRDDNWGRGSRPFSDLQDESDSRPGRLVAKAVRIHWSNKPTLGHERIGSTLSVAVDPTNGNNIYIAWADNMSPNAEYTIHVQRSKDGGKTLKEIRSVSNAICASLSVADNGTLGFLYQRFRASASNARWETHLEETNDDFGAGSQDLLLASVPAFLTLQGLPYLGDYYFLLAVGKEFRGVFSTNNLPDTNSFPFGVTYLRKADKVTHVLGDGHGGTVGPSIDPFYFSASVMENPLKSWDSSSTGQAGPSGRSQPAQRLSGGSLVMSSQVPAVNPESELKSRLNAADVIMVGRVLEIRNAGKTFTTSGGGLTALPESKPRISEHDPDWKEAVIQAERPIKGVVANQRVVVRFPDSLDLMWRNYPKFKEGQDGVFVLKKSRGSGGSLQSLSDGTPLFAPPTKQDVLPKDQVQTVIKLVLE
ncbi:MAG TPA: hypothetical protein VN937_19485 [Blastocatellia bacterium]|nr:hypothetical protein [Blastocatellia bacterium]